jgi:uncharacterized membrane protein
LEIGPPGRHGRQDTEYGTGTNKWIFNLALILLVTGSVADVLVLAAAVASLVAVGALLSVNGPSVRAETVQALVSIGAVGVAWASVHTVFTTRYARLYYSGTPGGVDFNEDEPPSYSDFAYLAFTIGMTFQVSDTDIQTPALRRVILRHMLLSYLFGAVIVAVTINLIASTVH